MTKVTMMGAALLLLAAPAMARDSGILGCQIDLTQFANDVYASKDQLSPGQRQLATQMVEVGRGQCRSGPDIVAADLDAVRKALPLRHGARSTASSQFDDFYPATPQELSALRD